MSRVARRQERPRRRLGVFGGTFDPPHLGHLAIAEQARQQLGLDRVVFVPAADPPHKRDRGKTSVGRRVAMTRLAIRGRAGFVVSNAEAGRPGPSYTVETLEILRRRHPNAELVLVLGEDSLDDFPGWKEPDRILALARLGVARRRRTRSGARPRARGRMRRRIIWLECPLMDVSSSELRARARRGASLRYLVPDAVAGYIQRHGLYRGAGRPARRGRAAPVTGRPRARSPR